MYRGIWGGETGEIVITRGGFVSEDDWFDYRLENDPRFAKRMEPARARSRAGKGTRIRGVQGSAAGRCVFASLRGGIWLNVRAKMALLMPAPGSERLSFQVFLTL